MVKPAKCLNCGHDLSPPSMMDGTMRCSHCRCVFDGESLSRWQDAFAGSRRALTMAEAQAHRMPCQRVWLSRYGVEVIIKDGKSHMATCPKHRLLAAIRGARTLMAKAETWEDTE